ncbi:MAG: GxxExxY protein [Bacteroidia bacterium]
MTENELSYEIIGKAIEVHKFLGPGLLESVYKKVLAYELTEAGFYVQTEVDVPLEYKTMEFPTAFRLDILVDDKVIVELKSVEFLAPIHFSQTLTYLRLSGKKLGLLINFNSSVLKENIKRVVNGL